MFIKQRACKPIKYNEGKERSKMEVKEKQIPFGQNEILDLPNGNHIQSLSCAKQLSQTSKQSYRKKQWLLISNELQVET